MKRLFVWDASLFLLAFTPLEHSDATQAQSTGQRCPTPLQNKKVFYDLLFTVSAATLQTIAGDPKHLGAEIGFFSILHTWDQTLTHHPHIHSVVTGGGLRSDRASASCSVCVFWRVCSAACFSKPSNRRFMSFHGNLTPFAQPNAFLSLLAPLRQLQWVVYAKPPFGGPQQVIDYLGRYTHRVAISNHRIRNVGDGQVTFQDKQYRAIEGQPAREMTARAGQGGRTGEPAGAAVAMP